MHVSIDGFEVSLLDLVSSAKATATRGKLKEAQAIRAKKYGIKVQGGSLTIPARFARLGAKENDFADPVHFAYPVWLTKPDRNALTPTQLGQVQSAQGYFERFKDSYDPKSRAAVQRRIDEARKKFEVGEFAKSDDEIEIQFELITKEDEKQIIYGIALIPDTVDSQGDVITKEEIEQAAHQFLISSRQNDLQHKELLPQSRSIPVESYIAPIDMRIGDKEVKAGSWIVATKIFDQGLWQMVKSGEIGGYSIKGKGRRKIIE